MTAEFKTSATNVTVGSPQITWTSGAANVFNYTTERDHLAEARSKQHGSLAAGTRLRDKAVALGGVFGDAVRDVLMRRIDEALSQHAEVVISYENAVDAAQRDATAARNTLRDEQHLSEVRIDNLKASIADLQHLLSTIVADTVARQKRSHGKLPDWFEGAAQYVSLTVTRGGGIVVCGPDDIDESAG